MALGRQRLPSSKPLAILLVFIVVYGIKKRRLSTTKLDSKQESGNTFDSQLKDETVLWVPYKSELRKITVKETASRRFDEDAVYFSQGGRFSVEAKALFRILFPRLNCRSTHFIIIHMLLLTLRTYLSLVVAELDGRIVRNLMNANGRGFANGILEWLALAIPASYTNALIKYFEGKIALTFRQSLTRYIHDLYVGSDQEYYKLVSLDGELQDVDHYITSDVMSFSNSAAKLYSSFGKPLLDLGIFSFHLSKNLGGKALLGIFINYFVTAVFLKSLSPQFGRLAAKETKLEGDYRNAHTRVITNAEEIAFYDGAFIENKNLTTSFKRLKKHIMKQIRTKAWYSVVENYILKYSWSASGFMFSSIPVFFPDLIGAVLPKSTPNENQNMGRFVTNKRIMLAISDAGGRIMYSIKDLAELSSYTRRVYQLISALYRVRNQNYINESDNAEREFTMADIQGSMEHDEDLISFNNVPVVVPGHGFDLSNGEMLIEPLTLEVKRNQHLLIVGSNGTGKSSISRITAGIWPVYRGLLKRSSKVSFISQRPYFSLGTLRDQVIYPQTYSDMIKRGKTDMDIIQILQRVNLAYLPEREGGLDALKEWKDVLSGGEKQRLMFARILYSRPKFAVIDEGTSAVSSDMEGVLYEHCKSDGITLLTITHRISLLKYHSSKLEIGLGDDGTQWSFQSTSSKGWESLDSEITGLREFLDDVPKLKERREEIVRILNHS